MKTSLIVAGILSLLVMTSEAAEPVVSSEVIDFQNDLIPVLTKHGCNAGACHGAAIGRGGLKLSLYGGDPQADYFAMARQLQGRRVNIASPEDSLVVLKPSEQLEHGGGRVFDSDSESARQLMNWVSQGAQYQSLRNLERIDVSPDKHIARAIGESIDLKSVAYFSDGSSRDVTKWTIFSAEDPSAVQIDPVTARAAVNRRGRHIVIARYSSEVVPLEIIVPLNDLSADGNPRVSKSFIDKEIYTALQVLGVPPSEPAADEVFRRRVTLDLIGRLPSRKVAAVAFGREALVDELLASEEFTQYWSHWLAELLRIRPQANDQQGAKVYHEWLAAQVAVDRSYQELAKQLINGTGDTHQNGPANFYRTVGGPREQAEFVSELFMGSRLRCANCHNHPLDRWTQDDYHGLSAIFAKVQFGKIVVDKPGGEVIHPRTSSPATERIPGERFLENADANGRNEFAEWMTQPANPYFAKAIVNRLWKQMMGRGLVEPVNDFRATNPATHPELLNRLATDFVAGGYSLRHTLRVIANSDAYSRSASANVQNRLDDRFYSHALHRPLRPEVLSDAISDVLGVFESYGEHPIGFRAVMLVDPKTPSQSLDILGRCGREDTCETDAPAVGSLPQKLHLFNGPLLNARINQPGGRLQKLINAGTQPIEIIAAFYEAALARTLTAEERLYWDEALQELDSDSERESMLVDFVWGLMTCQEFITNH